MVDIFSNEKLIEVIYQFLFGFLRRQEVEEVKSHHQHSKSVLIGDSPKKQNSKGNNKSVIEDLNLNIQRINFEAKHMQASYVIHNPHMPLVSTPL